MRSADVRGLLVYGSVYSLQPLDEARCEFRGRRGADVRPDWQTIGRFGSNARCERVSTEDMARTIPSSPRQGANSPMKIT
jgi:hypothetical protein